MRLSKSLTYFSLIVALFSCGKKKDPKTGLLDSIKSLYAGRIIHLKLPENQKLSAASKIYAYIDKSKNEIAFDLDDYDDYRLPEVDRIMEAVQQLSKDTISNMILIEAFGKQSYSTLNTGYVPYRYILEFQKVSQCCK